MAKRPALQFSDEEVGRLGEICQVLGTSMVEFIHDATMQSIDEVMGTAAAYRRRQASRQGRPIQVQEAG